MGGYPLPEELRGIDGEDWRDGRYWPVQVHVTRLREMEHRHRATMAMIRHLVWTQMRKAAATKTRESLGYAGDLIDTLATLERYTSEECGEDLVARVAGMSRQWQRLCNGHIALDVATEDLPEMPRAVVTLVSTIARELVLNAIRHGFPSERHGRISVRLKRDGGNCAILAVEDDGIGMCAGEETGTGPAPRRPGKGLPLVRALAEALDARFVCGPAASGRGHAVSMRWKL